MRPSSTLTEAWPAEQQRQHFGPWATTDLLVRREQQTAQPMSARPSQELDPLAISEDLVQSPAHKPAATKSVDFDGLLQERPLRLHEDLSGGNGGQTWPAGHVLAKYLLLRKRDMLRDSSIVELGAGGGLVGLAVAVGCSPRHTVHITDQQPMLALMQRNAHLNGLEAGQVRASVLNWGEDCPEGVAAEPDVILAADCVYFEPAFPLLLQTLQMLIGPKTVCFFCFKKRRRADMQFMKAARKSFVIQDVEDDPDRDVYKRENITLCTITQKVNG